MKRKKKIILTTAALTAVFVLTLIIAKRQTAADQPAPKEIQNITTQNATDSTKLVQTLRYPAITAGDQQITLTASVSGTVTQANFDLGDKVSQGRQLVVIDEIGNNSGTGKNNLKSAEIQSLEWAVEAANDRYKSAKRTYEINESYINKKAKEVAKADLETARTKD